MKDSKASTIITLLAFIASNAATNKFAGLFFAAAGACCAVVAICELFNEHR